MHIEKYKIQSCCAMILHYQRGREGTLERENIDRERTHLNYEIGDKFDYEDIKQAQELVKNETGKSVRKDSVVMADIVITAPPNVEEPESFFKACYESLQIQLQAHGLKPDTKLCGYVHMDETSPHMHLSFIPTKINKEGNTIFSYKTICNRAFYKNFHKDTEDYCEKKLGFRPSLLIVEDEDLNSLLSRADIDQKAYKELKDKLHFEIDKELKDKEAVLDDLKVVKDNLKKKLQSCPMSYSPKQMNEIQDLNQKLQSLKKKSPKRKKDCSNLNPLSLKKLKSANVKLNFLKQQKLNLKQNC